MRFVEEAKAAVLETAATVRGIKEEPAADENAIGLPDQRTDPAHGQIAAAGVVDALEAIVEKGAKRRMPMAIVADFDRILAGDFGNADLRPSQAIEALFSIEREYVDAVAERQDQLGPGAVDGESCGDLP